VPRTTVERNFQDVCQAKRCRAPATIGLYGVGLCDKHWNEAADESGGSLFAWCMTRLNRYAIQEVKRNNTP